jgi:colicin import membrane protein
MEDTMTTTELATIVKIDPKEYGLEESKAADIAAQFQPMLERMVELEKEFNEIAKLPVEDSATARKASELRKKYVKVRTGTAEIHKNLKMFYLQGGRFVDGWKNAQLFASQGIEEKLESIEKHAEIKEKERIATVQSEREAILSPYNLENLEALALGHMTEQVWENFLTGTKTNHRAKIEAQAKAEADRIAAEKAAAEERERMRVENEKLKAEAEIREKQLAQERAQAEAKVKAEREATDKILREEKARAEAVAAKVKAEQDAKIRAEREAREKAEAELKAKQEAEAKAIREAEEKEQAALNMGDASKFTAFMDELEAIKTKYTFKSKKYRMLHTVAVDLLNKTLNHLTSKL